MSKTEANKILDEALFEQLFKTHFVHLCNFAIQFVNDNDTAKDITQKVFIKLWEKRDNIDPQKSIQSYLFTSVRNRCFNFIRDNKKYRSKVLDLETIDMDIAFEVDDNGYLELEEKITNALKTLPNKCKQVFEMSRFKKMKYKDIAVELNVSVKTVEAHITKALKSLRKQLNEYTLVLYIILGII